MAGCVERIEKLHAEPEMSGYAGEGEAASYATQYGSDISYVRCQGKGVDKGQVRTVIIDDHLLGALLPNPMAKGAVVQGYRHRLDLSLADRPVLICLVCQWDQIPKTMSAPYEFASKLETY